MIMRNVGDVDAAIRIAVGLVLGAVATQLAARPWLLLGVAALAALVLGTGLARSCPLYVALGINTSPPKRPRPL